MSSNVYVYIIDSMFYENSDVVSSKGIYEYTIEKFVPTIDYSELPTIFEQLELYYNSKVEIHLVDVKNSIKHYYTDDGKKEFEVFSEAIKNKNVYVHSDTWSKFYKTIPFNLNDQYIFATSKKFINKYQMSLEYNLLTNLNFFYVNNMKSIKDIISLKKCTSPFNIYQDLSLLNLKENKTLRGDFQEIDFDSLKWLLNQGVEQTELCVKAGCLEKERFIQKRVPSWVLNPESYFMKGVIYHFSLLPLQNSNPVTLITNQDLFIESSEYRYNIVLNMCYTLYSYCLMIQKNKKYDGERIPEVLSENYFFKKNIFQLMREIINS